MKLLAVYGKGAGWTNHCFAVAESAARVGRALESRSVIDHQFLWSAALLHDIGRCVTHDPIMHGVEGYHLLTRLGHEAEAFVCASHILFGLNAAEAEQFGLPTRDFLPRTIEERLVPLVDFMVEGDRPLSLDLRFASLRNRNAGNDFFLERLDCAHEIARSFLMQLSEEIGRPLEEVVSWQGHFA
jgi:uncharacterized protein (TIGR00295 family)